MIMSKESSWKCHVDAADAVNEGGSRDMSIIDHRSPDESETERQELETWRKNERWRLLDNVSAHTSIKSGS